MIDGMSDEINELIETDNRVDFQDSTLSLSQTLEQMAASIEGETITVRELLALAGEPVSYTHLTLPTN